MRGEGLWEEELGEGEEEEEVEGIQRGEEEAGCSRDSPVLPCRWLYTISHHLLNSSGSIRRLKEWHLDNEIRDEIDQYTRSGKN